MLVEGLPYPTDLLFGPEDSLYISIHGAFSPVYSGRVIRFVAWLTANQIRSRSNIAHKLTEYIRMYKNV